MILNVPSHGWYIVENGISIHLSIKGTSSTHHLEGVGEGGVMVLGDELLSLFVVGRRSLEPPGLVRFFRSWRSGPKRALTLAEYGWSGICPGGLVNAESCQPWESGLGKQVSFQLRLTS